MFVLGIILGLSTGLGMALYITSYLVKRSNDIGDSTGTLENFGKLNIFYQKAGLSKRGLEKEKGNVSGYSLLRKNCEKAEEQQRIREESKHRYKNNEVE